MPASPRRPPRADPPLLGGERRPCGWGGSPQRATSRPRRPHPARGTGEGGGPGAERRRGPRAASVSRGEGGPAARPADGREAAPGAAAPACVLGSSGWGCGPGKGEGPGVCGAGRSRPCVSSEVTAERWLRRPRPPGSGTFVGTVGSWGVGSELPGRVGVAAGFRPQRRGAEGRSCVRAKTPRRGRAVGSWGPRAASWSRGEMRAFPPALSTSMGAAAEEAPAPTRGPRYCLSCVCVTVSVRSLLPLRLFTSSPPP